MSSSSRADNFLMALFISSFERVNSLGSQLSNFFEYSLTASSPLAVMSAKIASTVWRTLASAALIAAVSLPLFRYLIIGNSL